MISFFNSNGLVNNADKAAVLYNCKGKGEVITSTYSEKLLGLHINSDFEWSNHVDKLSIGTKNRIVEKNQNASSKRENCYDCGSHFQ